MHVHESLNMVFFDILSYFCHFKKYSNKTEKPFSLQDDEKIDMTDTIYIPWKSTRGIELF